MDELKKNVLYLNLREKILSGELADGFRLPPEAQFCRELKVGRVTLRSALEQLARDRLVIRTPRRGTFIRNPRAPENTILIIHTMNASVWTPADSILPGVEAVAARHGVKTEHCFIEILWNDTFMRMLPRLKKRHYRGVLVLSSNMRSGEPDVEILRALKIPVIMAHAIERDRELGFATIYTDFVKVTHAALDYLAAAGHRKLVFLNLHKDDFRGIDETEMRRMMAEHGLDNTDRLFYYDPDRNMENVIPEIRKTEATAVLAYSDYLAAQFLLKVPKFRFEVPRDLSVMGISGFEIGAMLDPPLTTVDLEYSNIGRQAMELLLDADSWYKPGMLPPVMSNDFHIVARNSVRSINCSIPRNKNHARRFSIPGRFQEKETEK